jgi:hypothetical protein
MTDSTNQLGYVYKITCNPTGKAYIGQTKEYKYKCGKPYRYGIQGRWNDHVSSAKKSVSEFANAIKMYSKDVFLIEQLETTELNKLDACEAKWIAYYNTVVPNGYNTARYSQNKHRTESNLYEFFQGNVKDAVLRKIHKNGTLKLVYVILTLTDTTQRRIVFGNNMDSTFEHAWIVAIEFVQKIQCPYYEDTSYSINPLERYAAKLNEFKDKQITKIRITNAGNLVAVYITTSDAKSWKDQTRICFGGKTIPSMIAYDLAQTFIDQLPKTTLTVVQDMCQSQQQVAAIMGEATP